MSKKTIEEATLSYLNKYAYPLNIQNKPFHISEILNWASQKNIYGIGRWGKWAHLNSDVCVINAINETKKIIYSQK